jgi:hypothetical protein
MINQSYRQVFVTNSPALLAEGSTVDNLGVGQVGIIDAATNLAVTAPTYAKTKAFKFVWGTPDINLGIYGGIQNENEYSKLIKGKLIKGWRAKKASRPQSQIISIGWSGDNADTATMSANCGDVKFLYLNFTGTAIDKLFSKQGLIRQYAVDTTCWCDSSDCGDSCAKVDPCRLANEFAKQIQNDHLIGNMIKVKAVTECTLSGGVNCYVYEVNLCDDGSDVALGIVQAQYPTFRVTRTRRVASTSTYSITKDVAGLPSAVSNAGLILIPNCSTCPAGYTFRNNGFAYTIKRSDAGTVGAQTTLATDYSIATVTESVARVNYEFGESTYVVISDTAITVPVGSDVIDSLGEIRDTCVLTSPSTTAWVLAKTLQKYPKTYRLTIGDSVCGTNRLTELQAAYPGLVVTIVDASGTCVHTYETTVMSNCVEPGCGVEMLEFTRPANFQGVAWEEYIAPAVIDYDNKAGIRIEVAFVNRVTGECTYNKFPASEYDTLFVSASEFNPDYTASNCPPSYVVREIQGFRPPIGDGARLRADEQFSKGYDLRERFADPVVREQTGYSLQADPSKYYDEYVLEFDYKYQVGGWSEKYEDSYHISVFFPEGMGKSFESALNGYLQSSAVQIDPVVL